MNSTAGLLWGVLFSSFGIGFFIYGRRQRVAVPFATGVALMLYPYFVSNTIVLVLVGCVLVAIPYFFRF